MQYHRLTAAILATLTASAAADDRHSLTIYSSAGPGVAASQDYSGQHSRVRVPGYAMVRTEREIELSAGTSDVRFQDVAAGIDPTTVSFQSLTDGDGTRVLEQNYQFDLVSNHKLLEKYLDKEIVVEKAVGDRSERVKGRLLGIEGGLTLADDDGRIRSITRWTDIVFPELPGGLLAKPTLLWKVAAKRGGAHDTRVSYQTTGMTWWADYNLIYSEEENACRMDLGAWVSIVNQSGAGFDDARLKLIAGDVNRVEPPSPRDMVRVEVSAMAVQDSAAGFQQQEFFEYHLYTLGRKTDLPQNSTKQVALFPTAQDVECSKELVFSTFSGPVPYYSPRTGRNDGVGIKGDVTVSIRFENKEALGLGMPLPAGRVRVSQRNQDDGNLEFVGEDTIDHTPRNETLSIAVGKAFDVVGERVQKDFSIDSRARTMSETIELSIRNQKREAVKLVAREHLYRWSDWKITEQSHDYERLDAGTIEFPLTLEPESETVIRYSVRYDW